ncbi:MAG: ATP-binding protein [Selenomonadaceae bacterium]|nr:ATP-binding protein [Selenomonadaceae bacterium]
MNYIERKEYLKQLIQLRGTPDIKVITGMRRTGKSVLMQQYIRYIQTTDPACNIIFINLQELEYDELHEYHALHRFVLDHCRPDKENILIIDEVQLCDKFELAINSLHAKQLFDIYITGSNAFLLSSDLATLFTGRTMRIEVYPFSFAEYCQYKGIEKGSVQDSFDSYVLGGGLSGSYVYKSEKDAYSYIRDVYHTIVLRDLVQKYGIRNKNELQQITEFMMDNISNLLSSNNICEALNKSGSEITRKTVAKYISCLINAFVFYEAKRYDVKGKKYLSQNSKFYISDLGMRYSVLGTRNIDYGRACENIVFLELKRRGYDVYVGKLYKKEIDFVVTRQSEKLYIQVSDIIADEKTFQREVTPLLQIKDAYPKILLANTLHPEYQYEGIRIINIADWLLTP